MHHPAVGLDDVGGKYEQRKHKTVALTLIAPVGVGVCLLVAAVLVYTVKTLVEKGAKGKACKCSERTACHETEKAANPFSCCHILLFGE